MGLGFSPSRNQSSRLCEEALSATRFSEGEPSSRHLSFFWQSSSPESSCSSASSLAPLRPFPQHYSIPTRRTTFHSVPLPPKTIPKTPLLIPISISLNLCVPHRQPPDPSPLWQHCLKVAGLPRQSVFPERRDFPSALPGRPQTVEASRLPGNPHRPSCLLVPQDAVWAQHPPSPFPLLWLERGLSLLGPGNPQPWVSHCWERKTERQSLWERPADKEGNSGATGLGSEFRITGFPPGFQLLSSLLTP